MPETLPVKTGCLAHLDFVDKILLRQGKGKEIKTRVRPTAEKNQGNFGTILN
jgi:hypothetical protein